MAASQMNIRMDNMLKQSGNAALSSLGITPSQAVRALLLLDGGEASEV